MGQGWDQQSRQHLASWLLLAPKALPMKRPWLGARQSVVMLAPLSHASVLGLIARGPQSISEYMEWFHLQEETPVRDVHPSACSRSDVCLRVAFFPWLLGAYSEAQDRTVCIGGPLLHVYTWNTPYCFSLNMLLSTRIIHRKTPAALSSFCWVPSSACPLMLQFSYHTPRYWRPMWASITAIMARSHSPEVLTTT